MRHYRPRLQYSHLKTHRLVAGSALIIFLGRSERRKEKKMEVDRKTRVVRRRNVRWTRRLCLGRISKSERRSALTHQCICFVLYSQLQIGTVEVLSECLFILRFSYCVFLEQLDENSSSSDSKDSTQDSQSGSTNYFLQYMGSAR